MCTSWSSANQISNFKFSTFFRVLFALWSLKYPHPKSQKTPQVLRRQKEVIVPGVPCVNRGNWGWESSNFGYYSLFVHNINLQNAVFYEVRVAKIPVLYAHLRYKCTRFRGRPTLNNVERFGMGRSTNSLAEKPGKCAKFIMTSSHEITNDPYASSNLEILAKLWQPI